MARAKWVWALAVLAMLAVLVPMGFAGGQSDCPSGPTPTPTLPPDAPEGTDLSTDLIVLGHQPPRPPCPKPTPPTRCM